jgi:hypothetical protein
MHFSIGMKSIAARSPRTPEQWLALGVALLLAWQWARRSRAGTRERPAIARSSPLTLVHHQ